MDSLEGYDGDAALAGVGSAAVENLSANDATIGEDAPGIVYTDAELQIARKALERAWRLNFTLWQICGWLLFPAAASAFQLSGIPNFGIVGFYAAVILLQAPLQLIGGIVRLYNQVIVRPSLENSGLAERIACGALRADPIFNFSHSLYAFGLGPLDHSLSRDLIRVGETLRWYWGIEQPLFTSLSALLLSASAALLLPLLLLAFGIEGLLPWGVFFALSFAARFFRSRAVGQHELQLLLENRLVKLRRMSMLEPEEFRRHIHYLQNSRLPRLINEITEQLDSSIAPGSQPSLLWVVFPLLVGGMLWGATVLEVLPYAMQAIAWAGLLHILFTPRLRQSQEQIRQGLQQSSILLEVLAEQAGGEELRDALPQAWRSLRSRPKLSQGPQRAALTDIAERLRQVTRNLDWYVGGRGTFRRPQLELLQIAGMILMIFVPIVLSALEFPPQLSGSCASTAVAVWGYFSWFHMVRHASWTRMLVDYIQNLGVQ